jgi:hypothetical protein
MTAGIRADLITIGSRKPGSSERCRAFACVNTSSPLAWADLFTDLEVHVGIRRIIYASLALPVVLSGALALTAGAASAATTGNPGGQYSQQQDNQQQGYGNQQRGQQDYSTGKQGGIEPYGGNNPCGDNSKCSYQQYQPPQYKPPCRPKVQPVVYYSPPVYKQPCRPQPVVYVKPPCQPRQPVTTVYVKPVKPVHHHKAVCTQRNAEREIQLLLLQRQHHLTHAQQAELRALEQLCGQGRG